MSHLEDVIDGRLIDILCARCGCVSPRPIGWLRNARDMHCPACDAMIVLNTSRMRQELRTTERQLRELHTQLSETFTMRMVGQPERRGSTALFAGPSD